MTVSDAFLLRKEIDEMCFSTILVTLHDSPFRPAHPQLSASVRSMEECEALSNKQSLQEIINKNNALEIEPEHVGTRAEALGVTRDDI